MLPDENKVVLFDRNRKVLIDMAQNVARATPQESAELARLLIASATARNQVGVARPEGFEHALPTIVIESLDELVATLRAA